MDANTYISTLAPTSAFKFGRSSSPGTTFMQPAHGPPTQTQRSSIDDLSHTQRAGKPRPLATTAAAAVAQLNVIAAANVGPAWPSSAASAGSTTRPHTIVLRSAGNATQSSGSSPDARRAASATSGATRSISADGRRFRHDAAQRVGADEHARKADEAEHREDEVDFLP
jgi:hypothetical protein